MVSKENFCSRTWYTIFGVALVLTHYGIFQAYFPNSAGGLGHDYSLFLPALLDGAYWQSQNGLFSLQWFTPAFCGGLPKLANPNAAYLSVPQVLTFFFSPLNSVKMTLLIFAGLGYQGCYLLLRRVFDCGRPVALLCSTLFLFNGLFVHRLMIGHLTFHAFMLIPMITWLLLYSSPRSHRYWGTLLRLLRLSLAACLLAYMAFSGMINLIVPAIIAIISLSLIFYLVNKKAGFFSFFIVNLAVTGGLSLCFSAFQLLATWSYLEQFPRDLYPLPGYPNILDIFSIVFRSLFIEPAWELAKATRTNAKWALERHEFELGLTFLPLMFIFVAAVYLMLNFIKTKSIEIAFSSFRVASPRVILSQLVLFSLFLLCLSLPIALTYYQEGWNAFLKQMPLLKSSSSLVRWYSIYIPITVVVCALTFQRCRVYSESRSLLAFCGVFIVVFINIFCDREFYEKQNYDPTAIQSHYDELKAGKLRPRIQRVSNWDLMSRSSQIQCYEPIFGYLLENYPKKDLKIGSALRLRDGQFNMKNPACYSYPKENNCEPGGHFSAGQRASLVQFLNYKPFIFNSSPAQLWANYVSAVSFIVWVLFLVYLVLYWALKRKRVFDMSYYA